MVVLASSSSTETVSSLEDLKFEDRRCVANINGMQQFAMKMNINGRAIEKR